MSFTPRPSGEAVGTKMEMELLANSIRNLNFLEGGGDEGTKRMELIFKLEAFRTQAAAEERAARRAAWTEETLKVILERQLFQESGVIHFFPELVWERVLKNLEDPKDKAKLSGMAPLWRELMKKERAAFLFNEVFAVFHAHGPRSRNAILECRTVSREWKKSIDNRTQNFVYYPIRQVLEFRRLARIHSKDELTIDFPVIPPLVSKFLEWSQSAIFPPYGNPFFSRKLKLCIAPRCQHSSTAFWREIERLLARWGHEVWTITFVFAKSDFINAMGAYSIMVGLLELMPNLRHFVFLLEYREDVPIEVAIPIRENPLPELPHLKSIVTSNAPSFMLILMLDKYGPTLDTFIAYWANGNVCENARLPNLKLMSLLPTQVVPLKMNWPSIQELDLKYENIVAAELPNLFRNLGDIGGILRKLNLILLDEHGTGIKLDAAKIKMLSLELPHLQEFSLTMDLGPGNLKTIDFILPMTKLKILSLTYVKHATDRWGNKVVKVKKANPKEKAGSSKQKGIPPGDGGVIIKFWEYTNRLYESNIWSLFPEMRKVAITTFRVETSKSGGNHPGPGTPQGALTNTDIIKEVKYTREGYKRYLMKRN